MTLPAGVILAGGQSRRMQPTNKALTTLAGIPLIEHAIQRLKPQVSELILNAAEPHDEYQQFGLSLVADIQPGYHGPLSGLYAALQHVVDNGLAEWLLLCPCDAPFLPTDLGERLMAQASGKLASLVRYESVLQATFSLWHIDVLPVVKHMVVAEKMGGFKPVLAKIPHRILDWEITDPSAFFNVNTPSDLELAEMFLSPRAEP